MSKKDAICAVTLGEIDATTITALSWTAFDPLEEACFSIRIINNSSSDIKISYDSSTAHDFISAGETLQLDLQTNSSSSNYVSKLPKGTVISVTGSAGQQSEYIYLAGYYNK